MPVAPRFVVVTGPPATGKSTLAVPLAAGLGLPLVAKDTIKDALMGVLPVPDVAASQAIGRAAIEAMFAVAAASPVGAVLDANLRRSFGSAPVDRLPGVVVEVHCRCPIDVADARYRQRAGRRHPGHFDEHRSIDELWDDDAVGPIGGGWPVLEVDTGADVDVAAVLAFVAAATAPSAE